MAELPEAFVGIVLADRYELNSVLGQGQGGMVFKARHRHLDRFVAVKLFAAEAMTDKTAFLRFEREAHSVGRLNHPNIVTVFDVGRWKNERPFLVMEYIDGQDLQDLMGKEGRLPLARCLRICTQVCSALHHAHNRGVVHRDLKPRNVMVLDAEDLNDFVKLVDFGIAKQSESAGGGEALTLDGYVVGTPQYMAPEQCINGAIDARTDVYSLCSVLFKMLTGTNPISGASMPEVMNNQIHQKPLSFEEACEHVQIPQAIQRVVYRGLEKSPDDRQESMTQLRFELCDAFGQTKVLLGEEALAVYTAGQAPKPENVVDGLRQRAKAGDAAAQFELVMRLEFGQGCNANPEEAKRWLAIAAQSGMKEAQYRLADHYLRGEAGYGLNAMEAFTWMTKSAEQGYDSAQFSLGWCYEHGLGTNPDLRLATTWYQRAAKQGNTQASEQLRGLVERLQEPSVPMSEVGGLLEKENESSDPATLYALACKVRDSGKRGEDRTRAAVLFQQAAHYGHELAQLAYIKLLLADPNNPDGQLEAVRWLHKAASEKNQIAMLMLAACLRNGIGVIAEPKRAQTLLEDLARDPYNLSAAQATLGTSLLTGDGVLRNIPRGIALLKMSADSGDGFGQWKLGICLRTGVGVMKDAKGAELMFQKSAEAGFPQGIDELWKPIALPFTDAVQIFKALTAVGNSNASFWLGICYENGYGVERDLKTALTYYEQSHAKGLKAIERIKAMKA